MYKLTSTYSSTTFHIKPYNYPSSIAIPTNIHTYTYIYLRLYPQANTIPNYKAPIVQLIRACELPHGDVPYDPISLYVRG